MWSECLAGRSGNDIASGLCAILDKVFTTYPNIKKLVTWSDSCVPQNRNQIMSYMMQDTMKKLSYVQSITMNYSEPGHSTIQEVEAVHSVIERSLKHKEVFSLLDLTKKLLIVRPRDPFVNIQMTKQKFFDYAQTYKCYKYSLLPFSKVKLLQFKRGLCKRALYKSSFADTTPSLALIAPEASPRRPLPNVSALSVVEMLPPPVPSSTVVELPTAKIKDVESLHRFMPAVDVAYVKSLIRSCKRAEVRSTSAEITACPKAASSVNAPKIKTRNSKKLVAK